MKFDLFRRKHKDKIAHDITEENVRKAEEAARSAKQLRDLLRANGVTLQILVATGGGKKK